MLMLVFYFFFFQAEDGIRDRTVTGVQTCALPIWCRARTRPSTCCWCGRATSLSTCRTALSTWESPARTSWPRRRSEERRVGKECRSRWAAHHEKINGHRQEQRGTSRRQYSLRIIV